MLVSSFERQHLADRVMLLYKNAYTGAFVNIFIFTGLTLIVIDKERVVTAIAVWLCMTFIVTLRVIDARKRLHHPEQVRNSPYLYLRRFAVGLFITAMIWSAFALSFISTMTQIEVYALSIILCAMVGGSCSVLGSIKNLNIAYMFMLLLPSSVLFIQMELEEFKIIGVLGIGYLLALISSANKTSQLITDTLNLSSKNSDLANQLAKEKYVVEQKNNALEDANKSLDEYAHTLEKRVEERTNEIYQLANTDILTGLFNRHALIKSATNLFSNPDFTTNQFCVHFIDLNGFKDINDSYGHAYGDEVLVEIGKRLSSLCLKNEHICARWGGDEFIAIQRLSGLQSPQEFAAEILELISLPIDVRQKHFTYSASIGMALYPEHADTAETLIQLSDLAMYAHKQDKDEVAPVMFSQATSEKYIREQWIKRHLSEASKQNQFSLMYQPILDISNHAILGYEALIRWTHPTGAISPNEFIPIAEKTEQIYDIGHWVLKNAIAEFNEFASPTQYLSINVSAVQLHRVNFHEEVLSVLSELSFDPRRLQLEITETALVQNYNRINSLTNMLQQQGIRIAIDDFGTGYSSLKQLQKISFDLIKIDRSFVSTLDEKDLIIISAARFIASRMQAYAVVEGVETAAQLELLQSEGVEMFQGFLFAKPLSAKDIPAFVVAFSKKPDFIKST
ncbi:MAG: EAL domain-containing protein [Pseudomonadota bacterium]